MSLPKFELVQPASLGEALEILEKTQNALPIAGGTALLVEVRARKQTPGTLVDLGRISDLHGATPTANELVIGAMTTIAELLKSPLISERAAILRDACSTFASPLVRNRATIGGNVAHGSPAGDMAPPLLVLDASIELRSVRGKRLVRAVDFWKGPRKTTRKSDEIVTSIRIPQASALGTCSWKKLGLRKADAISVASVAVRIALTPNGAVDVARVAVGAVAPIPLRVAKSENALAGKPITAETIAAAALAAAEAAAPIDDLRASAMYRRRVVEALVRRALAECAGLTQSAGLPESARGGRA